MPFAWINDNVERDLSDIYETVGHLAMIAGHPWKNLTRASGPVPTAAWPPPLNDYVDGPLRLAIASSRAGLIVELRVGDSPWFEVRQEQFEAAHDWGDYFGMSIDAGGYRVGFGDAWNYPEHLDRLRAEFSSEE